MVVGDVTDVRFPALVLSPASTSCGRRGSAPPSRGRRVARRRVHEAEIATMKPEAQWELEGFQALASGSSITPARQRDRHASVDSFALERFDLLALPDGAVLAVPVDLHWPCSIDGVPHGHLPPLDGGDDTSPTLVGCRRCGACGRQRHRSAHRSLQLIGRPEATGRCWLGRCTVSSEARSSYRHLRWPYPPDFRHLFSVIGAPQSSGGVNSTSKVTVRSDHRPRVATISALIVCRRFSAWSNAMLADEPNTSSVTSRPSGDSGEVGDLSAHLCASRRGGQADSA